MTSPQKVDLVAYKRSLLLTHRQRTKSENVGLNVCFSIFSHTGETEAGDFFFSFLPSNAFPSIFFIIEILGLKFSITSY